MFREGLNVKHCDALCVLSKGLVAIDLYGLWLFGGVLFQYLRILGLGDRY
ncbi:hypothetical protein SAMN02745181_3150 [Rubritalea squalenifaciens DSM 18772]|uniref:Uncharacterized protein n=1 Tax=Rubritalea squalenifaciens DSM 18772 TaxID=1123071 RepID=A0A1M6PCZ8_9BACT|nr:hypothetical protein SAMN02745181_3150 [Rubritalea squalenifaciens DSM 18772]